MIQPHIFRGLLSINTRFFPFDTHHCQIIFGPERAPNIVIKPLVPKVIVSFYNQPNSDWTLVRSAQAVAPTEAWVLEVYKQNLSSVTLVNFETLIQPYYDFLQNTTMLLNAEQGTPIDIFSFIMWEFEYKRNPTMLVNSWLIPFLILMLTSNFVFFVSESGISTSSDIDFIFQIDSDFWQPWDYQSWF